MTECMDGLALSMGGNISILRKVFNDFHAAGMDWSRQEAEVTQRFKVDFDKIDIKGAYDQYIKTEIPQFDPTWVVQDVLLREQKSDLERKKTYYLPDVSVRGQRYSVHYKKLSTNNALDRGDGQEMGADPEQNELAESQLIDQQVLESNIFLTQLQRDTDEVLVKAWKGEEQLSGDDLASFRRVVAHKQGQSLFAHLLN